MKASTMDGRGTVRFDGPAMQERAVPLVAGETIGGEEGVILPHQPIAVNLGQDGGTGHAVEGGVPLYVRFLRPGEIGQGAGVYEDELRLGLESVQGAAHGEEPRPVDVVPGDLIHPGDTDSDRDGPLADLHLESLPLPLRELLGIVRASDADAGGEDQRRGHDRAGQGAQPRLVESGDPGEAATPEASFVGQKRLESRVNSLEAPPPSRVSRAS